MILIILFLIVLIIVMFMWKYKFNIDFASFFKKGFKKIDNAYGVVLYCGKQRKRKDF